MLYEKKKILATFRQLDYFCKSHIKITLSSCLISGSRVTETRQAVRVFDTLALRHTRIMCWLHPGNITTIIKLSNLRPLECVIVDGLLTTYLREKSDIVRSSIFFSYIFLEKYETKTEQSGGRTRSIPIPF